VTIGVLQTQTTNQVVNMRDVHCMDAWTHARKQTRSQTQETPNMQCKQNNAGCTCVIRGSKTSHMINRFCMKLQKVGLWCDAQLCKKANANHPNHHARGIATTNTQECKLNDPSRNATLLNIAVCDVANYRYEKFAFRKKIEL
jgi:hypothetical protein